MLSVPVTRTHLERLLDPADLALRARLLVDLLERPDDDPEVAAARERVAEQPWVKATTSGPRTSRINAAGES